MSDHERSPHLVMTSTDTMAGEATDGSGKQWRPGTLSTASAAIEPGNQRNTQKWEHKDIEKEFWQVWFDCRDRLYRCCLKYMNFNQADAEDALSEAMVKAWDKVRKFAGKIANLSAWLTTLTRNLCLDLMGKRSRGAIGVDDIEWVGGNPEMGVASAMESPQMVMERDERSVVIRRAIASLPERMRETFVLHYYEELSYQEIVEQQGISIDCVYKRISQGRKKLMPLLSRYFIDCDGGVLGTGGNLGDANGLFQKQEDLASMSAQDTSASTGVSGEEQKREESEVLIGDIVPKNSQGLETIMVSVLDECLEVDGAESFELVDGPGSSKAGVEEKIGDGANVYGENVVWRKMPVMLSSLMWDLTWTGYGSAPFNEWWCRGLVWLWQRGSVLTDIVLRHSWIVPNWLSMRRDEIGRGRSLFYLHPLIKL